jgi:hypothetical protein
MGGVQVAEHFVMRWPELDKEVRVKPIEHNREVFDWFVENLPIKALQGHTVVSGYGLFSQNLGFLKLFPWRENDLAKDDLSMMPDGRMAFFMTAGRAGSLIVKWGEMTEPLSYVTWAEVIEEDKKTLAEVGKKMWRISMGIPKPLVHVEFVRVEG